MPGVTDAAKRLRISRTRVKQLIAAGRLRAKRDAWGYWSIDRHDLRLFARIKRRNGRPKNSAKSR